MTEAENQDFIAGRGTIYEKYRELFGTRTVATETASQWTRCELVAVYAEFHSGMQPKRRQTKLDGGLPWIIADTSCHLREWEQEQGGCNG